jgi:hypothetical protein
MAALRNGHQGANDTIVKTPSAASRSDWVLSSRRRSLRRSEDVGEAGLPVQGAASASVDRGDGQRQGRDQIVGRTLPERRVHDVRRSASSAPDCTRPPRAPLPDGLRLPRVPLAMASNVGATMASQPSRQQRNGLGIVDPSLAQARISNRGVVVSKIT